jgi:hypothetical protein
MSAGVEYVGLGYQEEALRRKAASAIVRLAEDEELKNLAARKLSDRMPLKEAVVVMVASAIVSWAKVEGVKELADQEASLADQKPSSEVTVQGERQPTDNEGRNEEAPRLFNR